MSNVGRVPSPLRNHRCAARGCDKIIPLRMLMCRPHWYLLPGSLRARIWKLYVPGQESGEEPISDEYWEAYNAAVDAVARIEGAQAR